MHPVVNSILTWLRAGYPTGVPSQDYVPLLALLSRRLSPDEVREVAESLARDPEAGRPDSDGPEAGRRGTDKADIGVVITKVTDELPLEADISRVRARLAAGGWPLADPFTPFEAPGPTGD